MRKCSHCGKEMSEGYCIADGMEYYCSDRCRREHISDEEYDKLYIENLAYYTEWEEDDIYMGEEG